MRLSQMIEIANEIAPPHLALGDDPVGLQAGNPETEIAIAAVALDATSSVIEEAGSIGAGAVFVHHPLIYSPLKSVAEINPTGRLVCEIVRSGVAVFAAHTNWDCAEDGLNDALARAVGIGAGRPLEVTWRDCLYKLAVFVPEEAAQQVRMAIGNAGGGIVGNYSHCSFRMRGVGSFRPLEGADPHIGTIGTIEDVDEWRVEALVAEQSLERTIRAMLDAHPYEEVAYDVIGLKQPGTGYGPGRIGDLEAPVPLSKLADTVSAALGNPVVRTYGNGERPVRKAAVCGGSGGDLIEAAAELGADAYITGEVKHHQILQAEALGLALIDATHHATESIGMRHFADRLGARAGTEAEVVFIGG